MSFTSLFAEPSTLRQDRRSARRRRPEQLVYANFGPDNGGIVIDISETGLQFQSVERVMLGDSLPVSFMLTGSVALIKATAEVVWCNDSGKGGGLKFFDLPKTARREISAWTSSDPSPATSAGGPARGNERASFNLLTTEGRVAPPEPVTDAAAMAMARLLVSARGYSRPDPKAQEVLPAHDPVHDDGAPAIAPLAATETPFDLSAGEAFAELAPESAALPDATAAEITAAEVANEVTNEVASEVIAAAQAVTGTPLETPGANLARDAAETAVLAADPAPSLDANVRANVDADAPPSLAPMAHADAMLAEDIADEVVEGVVAELEPKSALAAEIAQPLEAQESAEPLGKGPADTAATALEAVAQPIPEATSETTSETIDVASAAEIAPPPAEATARESATISESVAPHADCEEPAAALVEILLSAAAEVAAIAPAPAPAPIPVVAPSAPPNVASADPISIARKAKDARIPNGKVSARSAAYNKPNRPGERKKNSATIHDSMRGFSILTDPLAVPVVVPAPVPVASNAVHLPGWGAQVLKFAIGVGVGCCLVAGAFVGVILLGPGHRAFSFARTHVDAVAEASAPTVAPKLDVEVIDLNSRRWHLNDTTQDAMPFAPEDPVVELTPGDSQPAGGLSAPIVPVAKSSVAKSPASKSPISKLSTRTPKIAAVSPKPVTVPMPPASVTAQPAPRSDSPKDFALPSPLVARSAGNSTDIGAPSITETISSSISSPIGSAVGRSSAPLDPRTPVSSSPVFPSVLLLPPARHNADFHIAAAIRQPNPTYPPEAKRLQVTGTVRIDAFVGKDGRAHSLKVISGDPRLSSATLAAVSEWTFRPAQLDGESVESEVTISVNFDLH